MKEEPLLKKTVKLTTIFLVMISMMLSLFSTVAFADTSLSGSWSEEREAIHNGLMTLSIEYYSGAPFGNWYLYAKDLKGNWDHIADFKIDKNQGRGGSKTYSFRFSKGVSFQALALCMRDKGNVYEISYNVSFSLGSGNMNTITAASTPTPKPAQGHGTQLAGKWGELIPLREGFYVPYYLDENVVNCRDMSIAFMLNDYTGYPFSAWYLYAMDLDGNWDHIGEFEISKKDADGEYRYFDFHFKKPVSYQALTFCIRDKGAEFSLTDWNIRYYVK